MIKQHQLWIALLSCGVIILFLTGPLMAHLTQKTDDILRKLNNEKTKRTEQIQQWENDAFTASELKQGMKTRDIKRYLSATKRTTMTERLELLASASLLYDFSFTLAPTAPWKGNAIFPNFTDVTESRLTFTAKAPYESTLYHFLEFFSGLTTSHAEIQKITMKRTNKKLGTRNIAISGQIKWLMNDEKRKQR